MESALGLLGAYSASTATVSSTGSAAARTAVGSSARAEAVGYVEPDPEGWSLVASLAGFFKNGLTEGPNGRLINRGLAQKFEDIENSAVQLMHVAAYQLNDTPITTEHEALIASMPGRIAAWESFIDESLRGQGTPVTASAEARTSGVRPAVGHPVIVYVVAPNVDGSGELVLSRGAVYSYYESDLPQSAWLDRVVARGSASSDTRYVASAAEPFALPGDALHKVTERLTDVTASVTGRDRRSLRAEARLALEANVIRQTTGELWYTVEAPGMDGLSALTTIVSSDGRQSWQSAPYTIDRGRRYDMVPVTDLESGQYFIRVNDITGRMLASGRFMVVR